MDKIGKIIREEIEKFIIKENANFNSLAVCGNQLETYAKSLGAYTFYNEPKDVRAFFAKLQYYSLQIIFAIRRCVQSQNINESFLGNVGNGIKGFANGVLNGMKNSSNRGLNAYGINLPNEINFWNNAKRGYYAAKRSVEQKGKQQNGDSTTTVGDSVNKNNVQSRPLSVLLQQDFLWYENTFSNLTNKYGPFKTQAPQDILTYIKNYIFPEYVKIKQSQGIQNP